MAGQKDRNWLRSGREDSGGAWARGEPAASCPETGLWEIRVGAAPVTVTLPRTRLERSRFAADAFACC